MRKSLIEQMQPDYGYDENDLWRGMNREQVAELLAEMREKARLRNMLFHCQPPSPSLN